MLLAIDIGNTTIALGVFQGKELRATWRIATDPERLADEYAALLLNLLPRAGIAPEQLKDTIISSVVPMLAATFTQLCQRYLGIFPLEVGAGIKTGVKICTDNPREVGADRVVNSAAAHRLYGGPAIVIDMGTATTFDVVSKEGEYLGGAIAPGLGISAEALFRRTAKLPHIDLVSPGQAIGKNTITAMQSGIIFGYIGLVKEIVARLREEIGEPAKTVGTGGYVELIAQHTSAIEVVNPHLTLIGLRLIYELNRRQR